MKNGKRIKKVKRNELRMLLTVIGFLSTILWWILCAIFYSIYSRAHPKPEEMGLIPKKEYRPGDNLLERILSRFPNGFIFGKDVHIHDWLIKPEDVDGHILIVGGSGSGKTSCLAIPSVMAWRNRIFAIDIKGELHENAHRPTTRVFNPLDPNAFGYDPFYIIKRSNNQAQEIRKIALSLIPIPAGIKDSFWLTSAQNLLTSSLIHFLEEDLSFIECIKKIQSTPVQELTIILSKSESEEARLLANQFVNANPKELASVYSEMSNHIIDFVLDRDIRDAFSKPTAKTIKPVDLERGFDVFLQIPEHKLDQWGRILSLIAGQFLDYFERRDEKKGNLKPILFLLDEFPRLGKFSTITNGLATLRSKKITMCVIIQSLAQLDYMYSKPQRQVIVDNCQFKAILNATDAETQDYFSKLVGTSMKERISHSESTNPVGRIENDKSIYGPGYKEYTTTRSNSVNFSYQRERIIQPHEFATLKDIVLLTPAGFYRAEKTPFYSEKVFKELSEQNGVTYGPEDEQKRIEEENKEIDKQNEINQANYLRAVKSYKHTESVKKFIKLGCPIIIFIIYLVFMWFEQQRYVR